MKRFRKFLQTYQKKIHSLRFRVSLAVFLPLTALLGLLMVLQYQTQQRLIMQNLTMLASQTSLTIENSLQKAMLNHNQKELQDILDSIGQNQMLQDIFLMDVSGEIVFSPNGRLVGKTLLNSDATCQDCHRYPADKRPMSIVVALPGGQRVFRSMNPIQNKKECQGCHSPAQHLNGVLLTDISMTPLEASLKQDFWMHLILWGTAILFTTLLVNIVIERFVLRRLDMLSDAIKNLGSGQLPSPLRETQADEIGRVSLAFNTMARQIEDREEENAQLSEDLQRKNTERGELLKRVITAQEDERKRLARELHDEMGQALAVLALQTQLAHQSVCEKPEQARQILEQTQKLVGDTSEQMYDLILTLRPSTLDDLGLAAAIRSHVQRMMGDTGIAFSVDSTRFSGRLPAELEIVLYRVFQEALTNILRHAHARNGWITLALEDGWFVGEIADDGQGFDPEGTMGEPDNPRGLGLYGMRERVSQHNGRVEITSEPGKGTKITVFVPIREVDLG